MKLNLWLPLGLSLGLALAAISQSADSGSVAAPSSSPSPSPYGTVDIVHLYVGFSPSIPPPNSIMDVLDVHAKWSACPDSICPSKKVRVFEQESSDASMVYNSQVGVSGTGPATVFTLGADAYNMWTQTTNSATIKADLVYGGSNSFIAADYEICAPGTGAVSCTISDTHVTWTPDGDVVEFTSSCSGVATGGVTVEYMYLDEDGNWQAFSSNSYTMVGPSCLIDKRKDTIILTMDEFRTIRVRARSGSTTIDDEVSDIYFDKK